MEFFYLILALAFTLFGWLFLIYLEEKLNKTTYMLIKKLSTGLQENLIDKVNDDLNELVYFYDELIAEYDEGKTNRLSFVFRLAHIRYALQNLDDMFDLYNEIKDIVDQTYYACSKVKNDTSKVVNYYNLAMERYDRSVSFLNTLVKFKDRAVDQLMVNYRRTYT